MKEGPLASTHVGLALAFAVCAALFASPALSETPVVIACAGTLATNASGTKDSTDYYRLGDGRFQEWDSAKAAWEDNICTRKDYTCSTDAKAYRADGGYLSDTKQHVRHSISVDRTTGKVEEFWIVKSDEVDVLSGRLQGVSRSGPPRRPDQVLRGSPKARVTPLKPLCSPPPANHLAAV